MMQAENYPATEWQRRTMERHAYRRGRGIKKPMTEADHARIIAAQQKRARKGRAPD